MGIKECSWNATDLLSLIDGAELITIERDIYLCIWLGAAEVEIYDITRPITIPKIARLPWNIKPSLQLALQAIEEYFIQKDIDFEDSCLTTPIMGIMMNTQPNDDTEVN